MIKTSLAFLSLVSLLSLSAPCWGSAGTEGASFLDIPVGAGPASLGSAYSALATDAYAPVWNPAGLGFLSAPEVSAQHLSYLESIHYEYGSVVLPIKEGHAIGASIQYLGSGDIAGTDRSGASIGDFSTHFAAYSLAYGQKITEKIAVGLTGKLIEEKISDASAHAFGTDVGAMYQPAKTMRFAATVTNMGSKLTFTDQGDSLPLAFHLAGAYQPQKYWTFSAEGVQAQAGLTNGRFGLEFQPIEAIAIRAGYRTDVLQKLSALAGLSVGLGLHLFGQEFAYAWLPYGDLGDTQYFSLLLRFGHEEESRRNLIHYQNIKMHQTAKGNATESTSTEVDYQQLLLLLNHQDTPTVTKAPSVGDHL